jgi:hypothetical protein
MNCRGLSRSELITRLFAGESVTEQLVSMESNDVASSVRINRARTRRGRPAASSQISGVTETESAGPT